MRQPLIWNPQPIKPYTFNPVLRTYRGQPAYIPAYIGRLYREDVGYLGGTPKRTTVWRIVRSNP